MALLSQYPTNEHQCTAGRCETWTIKIYENFRKLYSKLVKLIRKAFVDNAEIVHFQIVIIALI